ncbi:MAG: hypothetical protein J6V71_04040 [Clostridia bacterium]|nr:hypothetical protein [Clostridia bacterium]
MTKSNFGVKFKFAVIFLVLTMLLGVFAGCSKPSGHVVGDQINVVDNVYHEVYIEQGITDSDRGLVVGIHPAAMDVLTSADAVYDGENELAIINGRVKGLTGKVLGSENNILTIVKGSKEYTLKYMYVTRAISKVEDFSENRDQFPSAAWINPSQHPEGYNKYTPYIFEMPRTATSPRYPTLKITGYYVLTADIDIGGTIGGEYNTGQKNVIKAGHAELREPTGSAADVGFQGTFDGRGHKLENFTTWQGGMFGYINGGTIKNLAVIGACNYWQGQDKSIFADLSKDAHFENLYVTIKQQKQDNGGVGQGQDGDGYGWARERWAPIFSKGTIHVKNCVLESFALDKEQTKNTNYMQFLGISAASTYENVHCIGSAPLAIASNYTSKDFEEGVKIMITEKELEEFIEERGELLYGDTISINNSFVAHDKYYYVMDAIKPLVLNRNPDAIADDIYLVEAPAGVERYAGGLTKEITIEKFYAAMKNDSTSVQAFMDTGCWDFDSATGALTWKTK